MGHKRNNFFVVVLILCMLFALSQELILERSEDFTTEAIGGDISYARYEVKEQAYSQQTDGVIQAQETGRTYADVVRSSQAKNSQRFLSLFCISIIFSYCLSNVRVFLAYIHLYTFLLARFLCELFTLERSDGKKRSLPALV